MVLGGVEHGARECLADLDQQLWEEALACAAEAEHCVGASSKAADKITDRQTSLVIAFNCRVTLRKAWHQVA